MEPRMAGRTLVSNRLGNVCIFYSPPGERISGSITSKQQTKKKELLGGLEKGYPEQAA